MRAAGRRRSRCAAACVIAALAVLGGAVRAAADVWQTGGPTGPRFVSVTALVIDPTAPDTLYAGTQDGLLKSTDAGATWLPSGLGLGTGVRAIAIDRQNARTLYAACWRRGLQVYGRRRVLVAINDGLANASALAVAVDPVTPSTLYAGTYYGDGLYKSTDGGTSWTVARNGLHNLAVQSIVVDPTTPSRVYAGTQGGFHRSTDGGATWVAANTSLMVSALAIDPVFPANVYAGVPGWVGVGGGVFKSTDSAATWVALNDGLTSSRPPALAIDGSGSSLYGGFLLGGVWRRRTTTGAFHTVTPCRLIDTRTSDAPALTASSTRTFKLAEKCGVPADASSMSLNVTVTGATGQGHLRLFPGNTGRPPSSTLNYAQGQTRANNSVSLLGAAGDLAIYSGQGAGTVHVIVDVNGYFS